MKQTELEKAAENHANLYYNKNSELTSVITESIEWENRNHNFIKGAEWQAERMYSEGEIIQLLIKFNQEIQEVENVRDWFEENKKK